MYYRSDDTFALSPSETLYLLIASTVLSGVLSHGGVWSVFATPIYIFCLLLWSCIIVAAIIGGGMLLLLKPFWFFCALKDVVKNAPPIKPPTLRKSRTFSDRCETGFSKLRDNNYDAIKLDSVSVVPLDETDIHAFRNTPAYKKVQAANKINTVKQYAPY